MKKGKRRSRNTSGRRKHADKKAEGTDRAENKTLPGLDHQDNTSMVKETESRLSSADSISEPPPSTEADKPDSDLESESGMNARDDSAADLVRGIDPEFDPKQEPQDAPTRPSDELLDEIDREITELIANIDAPSGAVFDQEREVEVSSKHNVTGVGSSSEVQLVKAVSEEEVAEGVDRDISPALNESVASELEVSAESEIATPPSVEEIIATMDEDALGAEAKGIEPEEVLADQVEPAPLEADVAEALEGGAIETAEKVSEPETSLEEDADTAPLEADVAEALEVGAIETAEKVSEPETSLDEDADTAPLEADVAEALEGGAIETAEKVSEPETSLEEDADTAPLEADVAEALEVGAIETAEKVSEPETSLEEDADTAPLEADVAEALEVGAIETEEKVSEPETSLDEDADTAPLEADVAEALEVGAIETAEKVSEPETSLDEDADTAPLEADVAEALEVGAIETAEKVSEPETSLDEDADTAPLEADVAEALEGGAIETAEKVSEPETSLDEDADTAPLEELISELDGKIGQTLDSNRKEGEEIVKPGDQQSDDHGKYVRFLLDDIFMAIPLFSALEVGHRPDITPLPNLPDWVLGISNIRGEIVSVLDLKKFFGRSSPGASRGSHLIIIHNQDLKVGIIVDSIMGIISLDGQETDVQPNPYRSGEISSFLSGVVVSGEKLLNILDVDRLLAHPRMTDL